MCLSLTQTPMSHGKLRDQGVKAKAGEEKGKEEVNLNVEEGQGQGGKAADVGPELPPEHQGAGAGSALELSGRRTESG